MVEIQEFQNLLFLFMINFEKIHFRQSKIHNFLIDIGFSFSNKYQGIHTILRQNASINLTINVLIS